MNHILFDLDHERDRLGYFMRLREKALADAQSSGSRAKTTIHDKWVEIYSERVSKLERQASKLGLKTQLKSSAAAQASPAVR